MITRAEFIEKKSGILKSISIFIAVALSFVLVFICVYSRFGIAGFAGLLGLEKQQYLNIEEFSKQEADHLESIFGVPVGMIDPKKLTGRRYLELDLTAAGMTEVINAFLIDPDTLSNLQIEISGRSVLKLSAIGNIELILSSFGESKGFVESSVGPLPDKVPVYIELYTVSSSLQAEIGELKIGATKIPKRYVRLIDPYIAEGLEMLFDKTMGIKLDGFYVENGKIIIKGEFPGNNE